MEVIFSKRLKDDLTHMLQLAMAKNGIVNIPQLAEEIRQRNESDNVALEDISARLLEKAQLFHAAMEFDSREKPPQQ
jgi:uncharacterized protein with von Willebrand factor type A (vWA) domain